MTKTTFAERPTFTLYDLHSHTTASDGSLTPAQLVKRAVQMRVGVLAITDHDTTNGLVQAAAAIAEQTFSGQRPPLRLINGVEISTLWEDHEIHIVALRIDPMHPALVALLAEQTQRRIARAQEIGRRLAKAGIEGAWEGALRLAGGGVVTRAHFARYLVEMGVAEHVGKVFKKYLAKGNTGYVPPQWCTIEEAIDVIHQAGGQAVIAHPSRYGLSTKWLKRLVGWFAAHDGDAIEVGQCQQTPQQRTQHAAFARDFQLLASQGSDFHQPCSWIELGRKLWLPANVQAVWQDWPEEMESQKLA